MRKVGFKTKDEADKFAQKYNETNSPDWFCPAIKGICRKDCICFRPAEVVVDYSRKGNWAVEGFYCTKSW
jgi:hypothetical protein